MAPTYKQSFKHKSNDHVELCVFNSGCESCSPGYTWGPGIRDHFLIHLVIRGSGYYTVDGETYTLSSGDLFLIRPGQLASYQASETDPWEYCWVGFNGAFANRMIQSFPFSKEHPVYHSDEPEVLQNAMMAIFAARGYEPQHEAAMVGQLYLFLARLMAESCTCTTQSATGTQYVTNAIKYIQFNYSHDIHIDDIAKAVGVSRSHLYRLFMNSIGQSPIDYLTHYRLEEACKLLKTSHLSIAEIAMSVGFFDKFYFSRVFKKVKGVPPSRYLAQQENHENG